MTDFGIRPATPADLQDLLDLINELAVAEEFPFPVTVTADDLAESLFGQEPVAEAVLAFAGKRLAGFAVFYQTFATTTGRRGLHLDDLFVRPEFQGLGYGRLLLRHLARIAQEKGCVRFEWWALKTNTSAIKFFEHVGARPMDELLIFRTSGSGLAGLASGEA
ncbi:GNAT family N-acetyltransferase [Lysobacter sp. M15]|uniref:GNAT family N-acetyltransferase n=1 Tax=Lysobacter sp. M15 TaxID=2916837 RepID=UPI001F56F1D3|nr:GNAT family N-acetyltransferase [Lysobacter sp. M15]